MEQNQSDRENDNLSSEMRYDGFGNSQSVNIGDGAGGISVRRYNLIMGAVLFWGFLLNTVFCFVFAESSQSWPVIPLVIGYLISAAVGILLNTKSGNPVVSFIGYNLVVLPVGLVLTVLVAQYDIISVANAFLIAAAVTLTMMLLSLLFPRLFLKIAPVLGIALLVAVLAEIVLALIGGAVRPGILDYVIALIFCGYIGYDWAIAQRKARTLDNAIDSACALYLDIINLFIRILAASAKGKRKR